MNWRYLSYALFIFIIACIKTAERPGGCLTSVPFLLDSLLLVHDLSLKYEHVCDVPFFIDLVLEAYGNEKSTEPEDKIQLGYKSIMRTDQSVSEGRCMCLIF